MKHLIQYAPDENEVSIIQFQKNKIFNKTLIISKIKKLKLFESKTKETLSVADQFINKVIIFSMQISNQFILTQIFLFG